MRWPGWQNAKLALGLVSLLAIGGVWPQNSPAQQAPPPGSKPWTPLVQALQETAERGVPTVVVVTSRNSPPSQAFRAAVEHSPEAAAIARTALFAEMSAEAYPTPVKN